MRFTTHILATVLLLAICAGSASGQDGWRGTSGLVHVHDAATVGKGKLVFSLGTSWNRTGKITITTGPYSRLNGTGMDEAIVDYHFILSRAEHTLGISHNK